MQRGTRTASSRRRASSRAAGPSCCVRGSNPRAGGNAAVERKLSTALEDCRPGDRAWPSPALVCAVPNYHLPSSWRPPGGPAFSPFRPQGAACAPYGRHRPLSKVCGLGIVRGIAVRWCSDRRHPRPGWAQPAPPAQVMLPAQAPRAAAPPPHHGKGPRLEHRTQLAGCKRVPQGYLSVRPSTLPNAHCRRRESPAGVLARGPGDDGRH